MIKCSRVTSLGSLSRILRDPCVLPLYTSITVPLKIISNTKRLVKGSKMVRAWFMDDSNEDQRLPHQQTPNKEVSLDTLRKLGVLYWKVKSAHLASHKIALSTPEPYNPYYETYLISFEFFQICFLFVCLFYLFVCFSLKVYLR